MLNDDSCMLITSNDSFTNPTRRTHIGEALEFSLILVDKMFVHALIIALLTIPMIVLFIFLYPVRVCNCTTSVLCNFSIKRAKSIIVFAIISNI